MRSIDLFATPDSNEALKDYMNLFCTDAELKAAQLGYDNYQQALKNGAEWATKFLQNNKLEPADVMIVFITVAGMRWNLYADEKNNEATRYLNDGSAD